MVGRLHVKLTPKAALDRIDGWGQDEMGRAVLLARVRSPPVEGKANAALEALVAKALGIGKGKVSVARGDTSRTKTLEIEGMTDEAVRAALK